MLNLKLIALLIIAGSSIVAGSSITYYYGFALPKKDQAVLALQIAKLSVTPPPTLTPSPTATPTPTNTHQLTLTNAPSSASAQLSVCITQAMENYQNRVSGTKDNYQYLLTQARAQIDCRAKYGN